MAGNLSLLKNVVNIDPIPVSLVNGSITYATKRGLNCIESNVLLQDVTYVSSLDCKLISIAQLVDEIYGMVMFTKK